MRVQLPVMYPYLTLRRYDSQARASSGRNDVPLHPRAWQNYCTASPGHVNEVCKSCICNSTFLIFDKMAIAPDGGHHVPAWKRLGLTLKHAKDVAEPSPQSQSHSKRSSDHHDHDHDQNIKKRKLSDEAHPSSPAPKKLPADALATPSKNKSLSR